MKIPYEWLSDYINISDKTPEQIADSLSLSGTEVESVEYPWDYISGVVTAKILSVEPHPSADNLVVTKVDIGTDTSTIVTADTSVKAGEYVCVIKPGGKIEDLKIKARKLRGIESEGMFISLEELKLEENSEKVYRFPEAVETGNDIKDLFKLNSGVIEVEITANRGDCLSINGIARELGAIYDKPVSASSSSTKTGTGKTMNVEVKTDGCVRYTGLIVDNIDIKPSPLWMRRRLVAAGLRPINNVVDITNYVMLETGHPVHAFDLEEIKTDTILIRDAKPGEKLTLLDEREISLMESDVLITNGTHPIALAGIMGGLESGINGSTRTVFLEVAAFDPVAIRKTARRLGLSTDASYRFERGVDSGNSVEIINQLVQLLEDLAGGKVVSDLIDVGGPLEKTSIHLRKWFVDQVLGTVVPIKKVESILVSLGFELIEKGDGWEVKCPLYRNDIYQEIDLIEEIGRIYGYDHIESELPRISPVGGGLPYELKKNAKLRNLVEAHGFDEILTYGFINPETIGKIDNEKEFIQLRNPLSLDMAALRPSMIYGLLESASYNYRRQNKDLRFYEVGKIFNTGSKREKSALGLLAIGRKNPIDYTDRREVDFYSMKGIINDILSYLGVDCEFKASSEKFLEKRASADIYVNGEKVGYVGIFNTELADNLYEIKTDEVLISQIDIQAVDELKISGKKAISKISPFPRVFRDLSFLIPLGLTFDKIEKAIEEAEAKDISEITIADVYSGKGIPEGYTSLTITITFESFKGTLTDERVNRGISRIVSNIGKLGASLRG